MYRRTAVTVALIALGWWSGAMADNSSGRIYLHEAQSETDAKAARDKFDEARASMRELWQTLLDNQTKGYEGNRLRLETSGRLRFEAILVAIDELTWDEIWECGKGNCEVVPKLEAIGLDVSDTEKKALTNLYPAGTTDERLKASIAEVERLGEQIKVLTAKIEGDPDGKKQIAELPAGAVNKPLEDLKKKIAVATKEIDDRSAEARQAILGVLDAADGVIEKAETVVGTVFAKGNDVTKQADEVLDLLQKKDVLEALKEGPAKVAISKGREAALPQALKDALATEVSDDKGNPLKVETVGDLLDFLTSEHAEIEEIRLSLLQDMRANLVELRAARLNELVAKLKLTERMVEIRSAQRTVERGLSKAEERIKKYPGYKDRVVDTLEAIHREYQSGAASRSKQDVLDEFSDVVLYLAQYTERIGYMRDAEVLLNLEMTALDHRLSIERSRIAALGREAMISRGLEGLVSFTEGGITAEEIAGVIRLIQTGLLATIAATN